MQHMNNQQQGYMQQPPNVISTKDHLYITDMLSWNLLAMKKAHFYAQQVQDPQLKAEMDKAGQMHQRHYEKLLTHLQNANQPSQNQQQLTQSYEPVMQQNSQINWYQQNTNPSSNWHGSSQNQQTNWNQPSHNQAHWNGQNQLNHSHTEWQQQHQNQNQHNINWERQHDSSFQQNVSQQMKQNEDTSLQNKYQ